MGAGPDPFRIGQDDDRARPEGLWEGLHRRDERRLQRLHPLDGDPLGDLVEQIGHARQAGGEVSGSGPDVVGEQQLAAGRRPEAPLGDFEAALVGDPEPADLLDRVAPELHAQRVFLGRREDVEDAAADRELAAPLDEVGAGVGRGDEVLDDPFQGPLVAGGQGHRHEIPEPAGNRLQGRAHRGDDDPQGTGRAVADAGPVRVCQPTQHRQAAADRVVARREPLVREGLPTGEDGDGIRIEEGAQRRGQIIGLAGGGGEHKGLGTRGQRSGQDRQNQRPGPGDAREIQQRGPVGDVLGQPPGGMPRSPLGGQIREGGRGRDGRGHSRTTLRAGHFGRDPASAAKRRTKGREAA